MTDIKTAFKNLVDGIANAVEDAAHIDVVTLTGTIELKTAIVSEQSGNQTTHKFKLGSLYEKLAETAQSTNTNLKIVAFTRIDPDRDAVHFVGEGAPENLLTTHAEMLRSAEEARASFLKMLADLIPNPFR